MFAHTEGSVGPGAKIYSHTSVRRPTIDALVRAGYLEPEPTNRYPSIGLGPAPIGLKPWWVLTATGRVRLSKADPERFQHFAR
jgi:hypothetical protein